MKGRWVAGMGFRGSGSGFTFNPNYLPTGSYMYPVSQ